MVEQGNAWEILVLLAWEEGWVCILLAIHLQRSKSSITKKHKSFSSLKPDMLLVLVDVSINGLIC
ncbi:hypothetical protein SLEP1_g58580 [Rubroshorea leprosula]|nr:hypothetical protein SLEP1_g58580 [Rubroshorea leprosula]